MLSDSIAGFEEPHAGGLKRPGGVKRKQIAVPAQVAVDKPEGWRESKKRKGEGGKTATKGVAGFANLSAHKETYKPLLLANGWGVGGRVMTKNSWSSSQEAVKSLLEVLGKQRAHQMTEGSNVGGGGVTDGAERQEEGGAEEEEEEEGEGRGRGGERCRRGGRREGSRFTHYDERGGSIQCLPEFL